MARAKAEKETIIYEGAVVHLKISRVKKNQRPLVKEGQMVMIFTPVANHQNGKEK